MAIDEQILDTPDAPPQDNDGGGDPTLAPKDRDRLNGIVAKMVANKETDDAIKFVVNDFKKKYSSAPSQNTNNYQSYKTKTPQSSEPDYDLTGKYPLQNKANPDIAPPEIESDLDKINKKNQVSQDVIHKELTSNNDLIPKIIQQQRDLSQKAPTPQDLSFTGRSDQPLTNPQMISQGEKGVNDPAPITDDDVQGFIQHMNNDQSGDMSRAFLKHVQTAKPDKAKDIQTNLYNIDASQRANENPQKARQILTNSNELEKGNISYDPQTGTLHKPEGVWESIGTGIDQKNKAFDMADYFNSHSKEDNIAKLNDIQKKFDPDEPIPTPENYMSSIASGVASQPFKGMVAGKISGAATGLIPGAEEAAPAVDKFVTAAVSGSDYKKMSYQNQLQQNYFDLKKQGLPDSEAYDKAQIAAKEQSNIEGATGGLMMYAGAKIGEIPLPKFSATLPGAIKSALITGAKGVGEASAVGLLSAASQQAKNEAAEKQGISTDTTGEDIKEAFANGTLFTLSLAAIAKGLEMPAKAKNIILQNLAKVPAPKLDEEIGNQILEGHIDPKEGLAVKKQVDEHAATDASIPSDVDEENRLKIHNLISKRSDLEDQLETADKAFHPALKEKVNAVNDQILELSKNKADKIPLSENQKYVKELFNDDLIPDADKRMLTDNKGAYSPDNAEQYLKFVAEQAHGGREQAMIEQGYPESLIKNAKEEYPNVPRETITPQHANIEINPKLQTMDMGDMAGTPENEAAKKHMESVVQAWDKKPAADATPDMQGETFGEFASRVIPEADKILKEENHNTAVITHSSDLKLIKAWDAMGRPDIDKLSDEQKKELANRYNASETENGDLDTLKGDKGDIHFIRHGQTEDNAKNKFRSGNTNLTQKGIEQAKIAGRELAQKTGGDVPKVISSDLPRAVHTANLVMDEVNKAGIQKGDMVASNHFEGTREVSSVSPDKKTIIVHNPARPHEHFEVPVNDITLKLKNKENASTIRSDSGQASESGNAHETSQNSSGEDIQPSSVNPSGNAEIKQQAGQAEETTAKPNGDGNVVGVSHVALNKLADKLGLPEAKEGTHLTPEEYADRGRKLIQGGADVNQVEADFKNGKQPSADDISIARAHLEDLVKAQNAIGDNPKLGTDSPEYKKATSEVNHWVKEVVKPMGTKASEPFTALQGQRDLDTGSFTAIRNAKEEVTGKTVEKLPTNIQDLSSKVKDLEEKNKDLQNKLTDALDRNTKEAGKPPRAKLSTQLSDLASRIRTSSEFDDFLKGAQGDIQKMGVDFPKLKEIAASILEDAAKAVKAGENAIDFIRKAVDKLTDDVDKDKLTDALHAIGEKEGLFEIKETPEEKNIKRLEKQLSDLQEGNVSQSGIKREPSAREKELQDKIFEEKQRLGLTKGNTIKGKKSISEPDLLENAANAIKETVEKQKKQYDNLVTRFAGKKDNKFSADDSADIWKYAKENYIDGNSNFRAVDMVNMVSMDLGLTPEQVRNALGRTAETKRITDQIYKNQYEKNKAKETIQRWVQGDKDNAVTKLLDTISAPFRQLATLGHGHALLFTHAGMNLFDPQNAKTFFNLLGSQFKIVYGNDANYEKVKNDLRNDPLFTTALRAGLAVDPATVYDDWQIANHFLAKLKVQGNKGFLILKMMRMEIFKNEYNKLSNIEKADPDALKRIGQLSNHWTGTAGLKVSPTANAFIFAPNLIVSKFARLTTDPFTALNTLQKTIRGKDVSIEDRVASRIILKKTGRIVGMYAGALIANQALLSITGSKSSVNFLNPFKPDWLKFKTGDELGDKTVDVSSGMASTMQFLTQMGALPFEDKKQIKEHYHSGSAPDALKSEISGFLRKTLSPFGSTVWDVLSHHDYSGNTLPFFDDKPGKGKEKLDMIDYISEKLPIPIADGYKTMHDQMKEDGVTELTANYVIGGLIMAAIASAGIKISKIADEKEGGSGSGAGAGNSTKPKLKEWGTQ